ncbi:MAG: ATP-grasp fold amidoligase family protein [Candidatus Dormibacteraeota bacterium]|jgi:hypothetical protein|nr:ATP-grasp fold amidoligase family protein [Candidatus Dormibacteraeota bacterium]
MTQRGASQLARQSAGQAALSLARLAPLPLHRQLLFMLAQHRIGNFRRPVTLTEKINWRIIHDRREILRLTCDKLYTKELAAGMGLKVAKVLWSGARLEELATVRLAGHWVLKPNHGSRRVAFGSGPSLEPDKLREILRTWPGDEGPVRDGEWAYAFARRLYMVEEMLGGGGATPTSFKFFVFDGEPLFVHAITVAPDHFAAWRADREQLWPPVHTAMRLYTADWQPLEAQLGRYPLAVPQPAPPALGEMLEAARMLGRGFDFMRIDFLGDGKDFYFGELTPYPHAGLTPFNPRRFDLEMGSRWTLPNLSAEVGHLRQPA